MTEGEKARMTEWGGGEDDRKRKASGMTEGEKTGMTEGKSCWMKLRDVLYLSLCSWCAKGRSLKKEAVNGAYH